MDLGVLNKMPGDINSLLADPDFQKLDLSTQRATLSRVDPTFGQLSDSDFQQFKTRAQAQVQVPLTFSPQTGYVANDGSGWHPGMPVPKAPQGPSNGPGIPQTAAPLGYPAPSGDSPSGIVARLTGVGKPLASFAPAIANANAAASATPGPPWAKAGVGAAVGAGTYFGVDALLNHLQNYLQGGPPPSFSEDAGDAASQLAGTEVGGRIIGAGLRTFGNKVVSPTLEQLKRLQPTVSQALSSPEVGATPLGRTLRALSLNGRVPGVLEDLFTPGTKEANIQNSATIGKQMVAEKASQLSGRAVSTVTDPEMLSRTVQTDLGNAWDAYLDKSNAQAQSARVIAEGAPQQIVSPQIQATYQGLGLPIPAGVGTTVKGPIPLTKTLETANKYVKGIDQSTLPPTNDEAAGYRAAQQLLSATNAQFDPQTGKLLRSDPISFGEAWDRKQDFGNNTSFSQTDVNLTPTQRLNKALFHSMNNDIEAGIPAWDTPGKDAMKGWKAAKATVEERNQVFSPEGATVPTLRNIVDNANSPLPQVEATLADSQALQAG